MPSTDFDIVIIGAGALGCAAAYHLARLGQVVCVLEREGTPAAHASGKSAGMFRHLYRHPQLTEWAERSLETWPAEIREELFKQTGSLILGREVPQHHEHLFSPSEVLSQDAMRSGVRTRADGLITPRLVTEAYARLAKEFGATFRFQSAVSTLAPAYDGGWRVELRAGEHVNSRWVVNAAGAWINSVLPSSLQVPCAAYARHLIEVHGEPFLREERVGFLWDEEEEWYAREWVRGQMLVSICDATPCDPDGDVPRQFSVEGEVERKLGSRFHRAGRKWHCFRAYTPDHLPLWGEDPDAPGLFWLGGFGGYGMSTSFSAAADAAEYIIAGRNNVGTDFLPSRLREKDRQKQLKLPDEAPVRL